MCDIIREYISAWGVLSGVNEILENMLTMLVNLEVRKTGVKQFEYVHCKSMPEVPQYAVDMAKKNSPVCK